MQLQLQNFTSLVQNMAASVQGSAKSLIDLTTGSLVRAILEANAGVGLWMQWLIAQVLAQTRAATSIGADLDSWVSDFGLQRLPSQPARTTLTFSRVTVGLAASLPVGVQVKTSDASQAFVVVADTTNPSYAAATSVYGLSASVSSIDVPAQAVTPGASGNVQASAISLLASAIPGVDAVTNINAAAGGIDAESDAALRARFSNFIDSRSRATPAAIRFAISSIRQGLDCVLAENEDSSGTMRPGFFSVTVDDGTGAPSSGLIAAVAAALEQVRPIATQFAVQPPILVIADVSLSIILTDMSDTYTRSSVSNAIQSYISSMKIGNSLSTSKLAAVAYATSGLVINVIGVTINDAGDLTIQSNAIVRPGVITVN